MKLFSGTRRTSWRWGVAVCVLALLIAPPAWAQVAWRLATGYHAELFHTENIRAFGNEVELSTGGLLRITVYANNSLFKLSDIKDAVRTGRLDAGEVLMSGLSKDMPLTGIDAVPFIVSGYADARRLWKHQRPKIVEEFAAQGLQVLFAVPWPPQGLYTTRPVRRSADFKDTRMRTYNQATTRIAESLGATPVDVPNGEVSQALAAGRINAMITSSTTGVESKAWEHLGYFYDVNAWIPKNVVFVNARSFESLDDGAKQIVLRAARTAEERGWRMSEETAALARSELRKKGMKVDGPPDNLEEEFRRLGDRFTREWIRQAGHSANDIFLPYYLER